MEEKGNIVCITLALLDLSFTNGSVFLPFCYSGSVDKIGLAIPRVASSLVSNFSCFVAKDSCW